MSVPGNPVSTLTMALRWGDMDAYGHANNTVYFRFFEEARIVWLASLELGGAEDATGAGIIKTPPLWWWKLTRTRPEIPAWTLTTC